MAIRVKMPNATRSAASVGSFDVDIVKEGILWVDVPSARLK